MLEGGLVCGHWWATFQNRFFRVLSYEDDIFTAAYLKNFLRNTNHPYFLECYSKCNRNIYTQNFWSLSNLISQSLFMNVFTPFFPFWFSIWNFLDSNLQAPGGEYLRPIVCCLVQRKVSRDFVPWRILVLSVVLYARDWFISMRKNSSRRTFANFLIKLTFCWRRKKSH